MNVRTKGFCLTLLRCGEINLIVEKRASMPFLVRLRQPESSTFGISPRIRDIFPYLGHARAHDKPFRTLSRISRERSGAEQNPSVCNLVSPYRMCLARFNFSGLDGAEITLFPGHLQEYSPQFVHSILRFLDDI